MPAPHQVGAFEHADVLGNAVSDMANGPASSVTRASPAPDAAEWRAAWVGQRRQGVVQVVCIAALAVIQPFGLICPNRSLSTGINQGLNIVPRCEPSVVRPLSLWRLTCSTPVSFRTTHCMRSLPLTKLRRVVGMAARTAALPAIIPCGGALPPRMIRPGCRADAVVELVHEDTVPASLQPRASQGDRKYRCPAPDPAGRDWMSTFPPFQTRSYEGPWRNLRSPLEQRLIASA